MPDTNQHSELLAHVLASLDSDFEPDWEDVAEVYSAYASLVEQLEVARKALVDIENLLPVDNDPYDGSANRPIREAVERGLDSYPAKRPS